MNPVMAWKRPETDDEISPLDTMRIGYVGKPDGKYSVVIQQYTPEDGWVTRHVDTATERPTTFGEHVHTEVSADQPTDTGSPVKREGGDSDE